MQIMNILCLISKIILMIYFGYKFLSGDKEKRSTLWYGLAFIATLI